MIMHSAAMAWMADRGSGICEYGAWRNGRGSTRIGTTQAREMTHE